MAPAGRSTEAKDKRMNLNEYARVCHDANIKWWQLRARAALSPKGDTNAT